MKGSYRFIWVTGRPLAKAYFRLSAEGLRHVPPEGPVILASNHASYLDPPLIMLSVPRKVETMAKEELFQFAPMGWFLRHHGSHPVSRKTGDWGAVRTALRILREGKPLMLFPEGTRTPDGLLQPMEPGAAWIALKSGAPVVPVYVDGTFRAFPRGAWFPRPRRVSIAFGEPLDPSGHKDADELTERIADRLSKMEAARRFPQNPSLKP